MTAKVFIDTNLLVYAMDGADPGKQSRARELLRTLATEGKGVLSTQVAQELYVTATRKLGADPLIVRGIVQSLSRFEIVPVTMELVLNAIDTSILHRLSYWDALIVTAAAASGCSRLWSEDLNPGQVIGGVRIENPLG